MKVKYYKCMHCGKKSDDHRAYGEIHMLCFLLL